MLGEKWKALNEKQRTPYEAKAAADKKRYEEEKAAYQVCPTVCIITTLVLISNRLARKRRRSPSSRLQLGHLSGFGSHQTIGAWNSLCHL
jgi:hypothetical protein